MMTSALRLHSGPKIVAVESVDARTPPRHGSSNRFSKECFSRIVSHVPRPIALPFTRGNSGGGFGG